MPAISTPSSLVKSSSSFILHCAKRYDAIPLFEKRKGCLPLSLLQHAIRFPLASSSLVRSSTALSIGRYYCCWCWVVGRLSPGVRGELGT